MDGALMEIGPYRVKDDANLTYNEGAWDEFSNLLFVDNPVGTGFSYVNTDSYVHELTEMATQMVTFLEKFFTLFPQYEDTDVSSAIVFEAALMLMLKLAIYCRGIICWTAHSLSREGYIGPQFFPDPKEGMESIRPFDRQRLDIAS